MIEDTVVMGSGVGADPAQPEPPGVLPSVPEPVPETPRVPDIPQPMRYPVHPEIPAQPIHEPVREPLYEPSHTPVEGP
jgi:hypothetical protein